MQYVLSAFRKKAALRLSVRSVTAAAGHELFINALEWGFCMQVEFDVKIDAGALYDYMINRAYSHVTGVMEAAVGAVLDVYKRQAPVRGNTPRTGAF